jgi:hypothetical protein
MTASDFPSREVIPLARHRVNLLAGVKPFGLVISNVSLDGLLFAPFAFRTSAVDEVLQLNVH